METGNNEELKGWPIKLTLLAEKRNRQKSVQLQRNQAWMDVIEGAKKREWIKEFIRIKKIY